MTLIPGVGDGIQRALDAGLTADLNSSIADIENDAKAENANTFVSGRRAIVQMYREELSAKGIDPDLIKDDSSPLREPYNELRQGYDDGLNAIDRSYYSNDQGD